MKKILLSMLLICSLESASLAASEDVYVRQDVFDAKMEAFMAEIRGEFQKINIKFEALDKRISDSEAHTSNRIEDLKATTSNRIEDLKTMVYWGFSILGLLVAFAIFAPSLGEFLRNLRRPSITLEDVKRLIEENNARISAATNTAMMS